MRKYLQKITVVIALLLFTSEVGLFAQTKIIGRQIDGFSEELNITNWVFTPIAPTFYGSIDGSGLPNQLLFLGSDQTRATSVVPGPFDPDATLSITIPFDGKISFDFEVIHYDYCCDWIEFRVNNAIVKGGNGGDLSLNPGPGLGSGPPGVQTGSFEIQLQAGDIFTFYSKTTDNGVGAIDLVVNNFVLRTQTIINQEVLFPITYASPLNTAINQDVSLPLVWEAIPEISSYHLQVSKTPQFHPSDLLIDEEDLERNSFLLDGLNSFTTYFWRVRPNIPGPSPVLEDWMTDDPWYGRPYRIFRTKLASFADFSPNDICISSTGGQIRWPTLDEARIYSLELYSSDNLETPLQFYNSLPVNSFTFRNLEPGTYYWRVRGRSSSLCTACPWSDLFSFNVISNITLSDSRTFCEGGDVTLTAPSGTQYQWFKDEEEIAGANAAEFIATESGEYYVTMQTEAACEYTSEKVNITVNSLPEYTFNASANQICEGGSATLMVSGAYPAQWYRNGEAIGGNGKTKLEVKESGVYTVELRGVNGCTIMSEPHEITLLPALSPSLSASALSICEDGVTVLSAEGLHGNNVRWLRNGTPISGVNPQTTELEVNEPGVYTMTVTNTAGCTFVSNEVVIRQIALAKPTISVSRNYPAMLAKGYPVGLYSSAAPIGASFTWLINGEPAVGGRGIAILGNATVQVQISTAEGCSVISEPFEVSYPEGVNLIGINTRELSPAEIEAREIDPATVRSFDPKFVAAGGGSADQFQAFPNPSTDVMNVVISKDLVGSGAAVLSIRNILGREVMAATLAEGQVTYSVTINLSGLRSGLYVLQVTGSRGTFRKTVKKE